MFTDPWYGLSNYENYYRWNVLKPTSPANQTAVNEKLAFQNELRFYFGLTSTQVSEITTNWYSLYATALDNNWSTGIPSPAEYQNTFGFAYWQWAAGAITQTYWSVDSVQGLGNNAFVGFYEMSYFKANYFNVVANSEKQALF